MLLLDRVADVEIGRSAVGLRQLSAGDPWLGADGTLPPSLLAEMMAQCAGVAVARQGASVGVLVKISRFRARSGGAPGATLRVHARITKIFGPTVKARCLVRLNGRIWAAADLVLQLAAPRTTGVG